MEHLHSYSCMVVDDQPVDALLTAALIKKQAFLDLQKVFHHPDEAIEWLQNNTVDVLFLDIEMPGINGIALRQKAMDITACIFITSHLDFAVDSFAVQALDYIIKPLTPDRFLFSMERLLLYLESKRKAALYDYSLQDNIITIKDKGQQIRIPLDDILYLEALKDYTGIVTHKNKYITLAPFSKILTDKGFEKFLRIHRSYAVLPSKISEYNRSYVSIGAAQLPIGRSYKKEVHEVLHGHEK